MTYICTITNNSCEEPFPPFGESDNYPCDNCSVERMKLIHWADYYRHNTTPAINPYPYYSDQGMKYFAVRCFHRPRKEYPLPNLGWLYNETEEYLKKIMTDPLFHIIESHYNFKLKKQ